MEPFRLPMTEQSSTLSSAPSRQPAIILVEPQLGENIGAAVRAMANFGLSDLRLVAPRDGWPNPRAAAMASGADHVLSRVRVFDDLPQAVTGLHYVVATTARRRDMAKPRYGLRQLMPVLWQKLAQGGHCGILFGREKWGLTNEEILTADCLVHFPVDARFTSVNLAQSVLLIAYEWYSASRHNTAPSTVRGEPLAASREELLALLAHLERALDAARYFHPPEKRTAMRRNLRTMFMRADFNENEVRALRGVIAAFERAMEPQEPSP